MSNLQKSKHYSKFANCIAVKGYLHGIVMDLQRKQYLFVPINTIGVLEKKSFCADEFSPEYNKFIDFLEQNEIIFPINKKNVDCFPSFNMDFLTPSIIDNSIIDADELTLNDVFLFINQLDTLLCNSVQFRFYSKPEKYCLLSILDAINASSIESVEILMPEVEWLNDSALKEFAFNNKKLTSLFFHSAKKDNKNYYNQTTVTRFVQPIKSFQNCGNVKLGYFYVDIGLTTLSYSYNTCLFKKISIDAQGYIKNCPSCTQSFGNIKNTTLKQALEHPDFKKLWSITKDQVDVCKDCEFRHMCTDCRVYIKDPENIYSQPSKCTYNPYIAKWQGEDGYVPVEECGTYSREKGFVVNHERVAELNAQIWGE